MAVAAAIAGLAAGGLWLWGVLGLPGPGPQLKRKAEVRMGELPRGQQ
jgi:hypothetical protein